MEKEGDIYALILLEIENTTMHRLVKNEKTLFTSGICKFAQLKNGKNQPVYFLNLNSFYYTIRNDLVFIKLVYEDTVSYVFPHFDNGMSSITMPIAFKEQDQLDEILKNSAIFTDYEHAIRNYTSIRLRVQQNCSLIATEPIYYPDSIKKAISTSGKFLGNVFTYIGGFLKTGVEKAGGYLDTKIEQGQPTEIKSETKEKWEKIKKGTNQFIQVSAEYASNILAPVIEKGKQYTNEIKEKIDISENENVKYAKELAQVSGKAIGEAFDGLVKGSVLVGKQIGEQGKKLITKKYGEDVINTIAGHSEEKKEEKKEEIAELKQVQMNELKEQSHVDHEAQPLISKEYPSLIPDLSKNSS